MDTDVRYEQCEEMARNALESEFAIEQICEKNKYLLAGAEQEESAISPAQAQGYLLLHKNDFTSASRDARTMHRTGKRT